MKPLTKGMIELLMDCHERELMNLPLNHGTVKYAGSLLKRKLVTSKVCSQDKGGNIYLYTTQLGRDYLSTIK
jgi:hypothetical protein